jgi:LysR family glycine cleavage system transcriptional activator
LLGLRAFAEAADALSMQAAAARLGVTAGAVSQQIALLERRYGVRLFERRHRSLALTAAGRRLRDGLGDAYRRIQAASDALARDASSRASTLRVSTTASFAASWLAPRLGRFTARYPRVDIQLMTGDELVPIGAGGVDVAIRHGLGRWPGLVATPLLRPRLLPVGSPALLAQGPPIRRPADCLRYRLLHDAAAADWRLWFEALGEDGDDPRLARGTRFANATLIVRAAAAGQGLALLRDVYVTDELRDGRLAVALEHRWPAHFAYYVVTAPTARARHAPVARFTAWLSEEAAAA